MILTQAQNDQFWHDGYLNVADAVAPPQLAALNAQLDAWIEESHGHAGNFGKTIDDNARFDLEPGHSAERPRNLSICDYTAADAVHLGPPAVPSSLTGMIVRGKLTRVARLKGDTIELPTAYKEDSFFGLQATAVAAK